jgi:hypothetical protein
MSAQDVIQQVYREIGLSGTATFSDTSYEAQQVINEINEGGRDIASRAEWSKMFSTFTAATGSTAQPLPADFQEMADSGTVSAPCGAYRPVTAPELWSFLSRSESNTGYYHLRGGNILFSPALSDDATVTYLSRNWVDGGKSKITDDGDALLIPERLLVRAGVWRWNRLKGFAYDDLAAEFEADLETYIKADRGA